MAHFAEMDENLNVIRVIVINNSDIGDLSFPESESVGIAFCKSLFGAETNWLQTSYNAAFRSNYAGVGFNYDAGRDALISPKPYPSWVLDETTCKWQAPIPFPSDGEDYIWDEGTQHWVLFVKTTKG
jgi:hypothetical protein